MAVAFDAVGPAGGAGTHSAAAASPLQWTHVNGGNAILVAATTFTGSANTVTGVTYGGQTIPILGFIPANNVSGGGVALYGLAGASVPTGSNQVSVAYTGTSGTIGGSVSYTGAGSLSAASTNYGNGATYTSTAITTHSGGMLAAAACTGSSGGSWAVTGGSLRWKNDESGGSGADNAAAGDIASTGLSQTIVITGAADDWGIVAVEVIAGVSATNAHAVLPAGTATAPAAGTTPHTLPSNTKGAVTAADLGGNYGSWATPDYAEGGP